MSAGPPQHNHVLQQHRPLVALGPAVSNSERRELATYSCVTCARRKVKCDKILPICSTCRKSRLDCIYQAPPPRKQKRNAADDLRERLQKCEKLLEDHGISAPDAESGATSSEWQPLNADVPRLTDGNATNTGTAANAQRVGKLLSGRGKTRYVNSTLWKTLGEEDLDSSSDESDGEPLEAEVGGGPSSSSHLDPVSASILGPGSPCQDLVNWHPTYENALKLWKVYLQYVEPIVKLIHAPSTLAMVQRAASAPGSVSKPTECLLFAIYHFAVHAMTESECEQELSESRGILQTRYREALRLSLTNTSFLRTSELSVVQAYMLYLLSTRNSTDPNTFWVLTGVAVRIAQRMGLHRDGEELNLKPFDTQMRRRVFWQLLSLDGVAGQLSGVGITIFWDSWSTKQPLNINDDDMYPEMVETPEACKGATDMIFCLARSEIGKASKIIPALNSWIRPGAAKENFTSEEMEKAIEGVEATIETKYLRYCDIFQPLHCLAMFMARGGLKVVRFRIKISRVVPNHNMSEDDRKDLLARAFELVELDIAVNKNPTLSRFRWHLSAMYPWDALVWTLNDIRRTEPLIDLEKAWRAIGEMYECHPEFLAQKRALHIAAGKLTLKAWDSHPKVKCFGENEPSFVARLRSACGRRDASRQNSSRALLTPHSADSTNDTPAHVPDVYGAPLDPMTVSSADDFTSDFDWIFWDQLIRDPDQLPAS